MKLYPWDNSKDAFWINPENGLMWYVDEEVTALCTRKLGRNYPKLNATAFIVAQQENNKIVPINRVLIDKKTNTVLHTDTSLEAMRVKIKMIRFSKAKF
ncbi:MAG: hypothetical protein WC466_08055 [Candidatus Izemoplasmatales bacterium]